MASVSFVLAGAPGGAAGQPTRDPGTVFRATAYGPVAAASVWEPRTSGFVPAGTPPTVPQRPTVTDPTGFLHAQELLSKAPKGKKVASTSAEGTGATALGTPVAGLNFEGSFRAEFGTTDLKPSDSNGAAGDAHYVEATNTSLDVFSKANGALVQHYSLNGFFGYVPKFIFDPRVVYDATWKRWIVVAIAYHEATGVQRFFIAASQTSNPTGLWWKYPPIDVDLANNGEFFDFPQLGLDQDAVIVTANIFASEAPGAAYKRSVILPIAKARLYNGLSWPLRIISMGDLATIAPPIVAHLDQNRSTYLLVADQSGSSIALYRAQHLSRSTPTITLQANLAVPAYTSPPAAQQPGTNVLLKTFDARFVNASTQNGNALWNVHTINYQNFPAPRFYEINTATNSIAQSGLFFASSSSNDWNASIAANGGKEAFVTWTATDPPKGVNVQVRYSGRQPSDPLNSMNAPGSALFTSSTFFASGENPDRWGDYSAVSLDPQSYAGCAAGRRAWIVNQKNNTNYVWGTRIGRIQFC